MRRQKPECQGPVAWHLAGQNGQGISPRALGRNREEEVHAEKGISETGVDVVRAPEGASY